MPAIRALSAYGYSSIFGTVPSTNVTGYEFQTGQSRGISGTPKRANISFINANPRDQQQCSGEDPEDHSDIELVLVEKPGANSLDERRTPSPVGWAPAVMPSIQLSSAKKPDQSMHKMKTSEIHTSKQLNAERPPKQIRQEIDTPGIMVSQQWSVETEQCGLGIQT